MLRLRSLHCSLGYKVENAKCGVHVTVLKSGFINLSLINLALINLDLIKSGVSNDKQCRTL